MPQSLLLLAVTYKVESVGEFKVPPFIVSPTPVSCTSDLRNEALSKPSSKSASRPEPLHRHCVQTNAWTSLHQFHLESFAYISHQGLSQSFLLQLHCYNSYMGLPCPIRMLLCQSVLGANFVSETLADCAYSRTLSGPLVAKALPDT